MKGFGVGESVAVVVKCAYLLTHENLKVREDNTVKGVGKEGEGKEKEERIGEKERRREMKQKLKQV